MINLDRLRIEGWGRFLIECINRDSFFCSEIGKKLDITPSQSFAIVFHLKRCEFVEIFEQPVKRKKCYKLTKKGKQYALYLLEIKNHIEKYGEWNGNK